MLEGRAEPGTSQTCFPSAPLRLLASRDHTGDGQACTTQWVRTPGRGLAYSWDLFWIDLGHIQQ